MTRPEFVERATRDAEKKLSIPRGWWGTWRDVSGPNGQRVLFSAGVWTVSLNGVRISRHDSRPFALRKAAKIVEGEK